MLDSDLRVPQGRGPRWRARGTRPIAAAAVVVAASACSPAGGGALSMAGPWTKPAAATASASHPAAPAAAKGGAPSGASVTITAVGDTMLGSTPNLPPDPGGYLDAVKGALSQGQIVFANLEGTLTTSTASKCPAPLAGGAGPGASGTGGGKKGAAPTASPAKAAPPTCFAFRDPPEYASYLKQAGFTILNDANNHVFDFGAAGQTQTVASIHAAGLAQTGLPGEITTVTANGVKVAFLGFAPYDYDSSLLDLPAARALIKQASGQAQLVVVYMHAGAEGPGATHVTGQEEAYLGEDRGNAEAFAHMAVDAGASLVIASGPHVLRGMQFYKGHLICYSLGNFAGYSNFSTGGDRAMSAILRVTLSAQGKLESARVYPVQLSPEGRPSLGGGAAAFMASLSVADFGPTAARIKPSGVIDPS